MRVLHGAFSQPETEKDDRRSVLYHFSENPAIERFLSRVTPSSSLPDEFVWAVDAEHAHLYYFPRDCPRVCFYASEATTPEDQERFLGHTSARHVAAIEAGWLPAMRETSLFRYEFRPDGFELLDAGAGYWVSRSSVEPLAVEPVGDLLEALAHSGVELRMMPSLWLLRDAVIASSLQFSVIRWRNAAPRQGEGLVPGRDV